MDHSHIVQAGDLERYASTRVSQAMIPELVFCLVKQSCRDLTVCRIPYGNAVNQPGNDGLVETADGYHEFVPKGMSYWEIGTGANPQGKASKDFEKRTAQLDDSERAVSTFVFVTPRSFGSEGWNERDQSKWLKRQEGRGWKDVRIIDGIKLADWLREFPGVGKWMATKIPITSQLGSLSTPTEHWYSLISLRVGGDPPFPPGLFTVGRAVACAKLRELFEGKMQSLTLNAESTFDVDDFVSAYLASLDHDTCRLFSQRCLFIKDEQAWLSIVETRSPHVLVADPRLSLRNEDGAALLATAFRKGHSVVIPHVGYPSNQESNIAWLKSPSQSQIESVLIESGFPDTRAKELARKGADRISVLRRQGTIPPYATWSSATLLAQAGLPGKWDGSNPTDRAAIELLLNCKYSEWIESLRLDAVRTDSPLIQENEKWKFVAREDAWDHLGSRITDADLIKFQEMAVGVLCERDPKFDLPKEERYAARIYSKVLLHSSQLREGIVETLALLGSRSRVLTSCSDGKAVVTALLVVRSVLHGANWERWASLDSLLPLLAEASPDEFLDAVESVMVDLNNTPFHTIFSEEGGGGFGGWNYMTGLLWALETLAWSPDYLSRVSIVLAEIASFDPGGNWANRPSNSLAGIFLPWFVQTTAPFAQRLSAIEAVVREQPAVGWKLLLALLPDTLSHSIGSHRPVWRNYIPLDWTGGSSWTEYWKQVGAYSNLAVRLAKGDRAKLCELVERMSDIPKEAHDELIEYLTSSAVMTMPEADRMPLWESLDQLVRKHRKFSSADWAMPEDAVKRIELVAQSLSPTSPTFRYHHLFDGRDFELFDNDGDYKEQLMRIHGKREEAMAEILDAVGMAATIEFAEKVAAPDEVGRALGMITPQNVEDSLLPYLLDSEDRSHVRFIGGFIWAKFVKLGIDWVDSVLGQEWSPEHRARFLTFLPFEEEIWERVSKHLSTANEALYWKSARVNPYGSVRDLTLAIEKLLEFGRAGAAVTCSAHSTHDEDRFNEPLATRALLAVLASEQGDAELDRHRVIELIQRLQESTTTDMDLLFQIEWGFLPLLDRSSSGSPLTLQKRLASDPAFFAEVIGLVFPSKIAREVESEPYEQRVPMATNAYRLIMEWKRSPGVLDDGTFSPEVFSSWLSEARKATEETGHTTNAQFQIGKVLAYAPPDPDGLWVHSTVAAALNSRDTGSMRSGFTSTLFNNRGVHGFTHGEEERRLASDYRSKAEVLNHYGYSRLATAMREYAEHYDRRADQEASRNPFDD